MAQVLGNASAARPLPPTTRTTLTANTSRERPVSVAVPGGARRDEHAELCRRNHCGKRRALNHAVADMGSPSRRQWRKRTAVLSWCPNVSHAVRSSGAAGSDRSRETIMGESASAGHEIRRPNYDVAVTKPSRTTTFCVRSIPLDYQPECGIPRSER